MPLYDYQCDYCGFEGEFCPAIVNRDAVSCPTCDRMLTRLLSAPLGRIAGRVVQGGGPDRFTADVMGIPLKDLPAGLRSSG